MRSKFAAVATGLVGLAGFSGLAFSEVADPKSEQSPGPRQPVSLPDGPALNKHELGGGLITEDIKLGSGYEVQPGGAFVAYYTVKLKDSGTIVDSAIETGQPATVGLSGAVEGWRKGVPGMKIGGIRKLTIPAQLGYSKAGAGAIPADSDLVVTIQLVDALQTIDKKEGAGEPAKGRCVAVTAHTITDQSGKILEQYDAGNPYVWIPEEMQAMQYGIEGMKVGGKRTLIVPAQMNTGNTQSGGTRTGGVPVTIEFEIVGLRVLGDSKAFTAFSGIGGC